VKNISTRQEEGLTVAQQSSVQSVSDSKSLPRPTLRTRSVEAPHPQSIEMNGAAIALQDGMRQAVVNADQLADVAQRGYQAIAAYQQQELDAVVSSFAAASSESVKRTASELHKQSEAAFTQLEQELATIIPGYGD
jgi:hypothetical protein